MSRPLRWIVLGAGGLLLAALAVAIVLGRMEGTSLPAAAPGPPAAPQPQPQAGARVDEGPAEPVPVAVAAVVRRPLRQEAAYYATLEPVFTVRLAPRVGGRVVEVPVRVGDRVKAGQLLLRVDTAELQAQADQAEAALAAAKARYERLKAGATREELEQAEAAVAQAEAQLEAARKEFERTAMLKQSGAVADQAYDAAQSRFQQADAQLRSARARLESLKAGAAPQDLEAAEAQVRQAEAALRLARIQLRNASLTAPVDGTVSAVALHVGETAAPGTTAVTLVGVDELKAVVRVPGQDVLRLRPGLPVGVDVPALPGQAFTGRIERLDPVADPQSHLFGVEVRVPNPAGLLRAGLDVTVHVPLAAVDDALVVPEQAILRWNGQTGAFVVEGERVRFQALELGFTDGTWRQVRSGLQDGQKVVTTGKERLEPGAAIRIAGQEAPQR